jgi:hypothetical protein
MIRLRRGDPAGRPLEIQPQALVTSRRSGDYRIVTTPGIDPDRLAAIRTRHRRHRRLTGRASPEQPNRVGTVEGAGGDQVVMHRPGPRDRGRAAQLKGRGDRVARASPSSDRDREAEPRDGVAESACLRSSRGRREVPILGHRRLGDRARNVWGWVTAWSAAGGGLGGRMSPGANMGVHRRTYRCRSPGGHQPPGELAGSVDGHRSPRPRTRPCRNASGRVIAISGTRTTAGRPADAGTRPGWPVATHAQHRDGPCCCGLR